MMSIMRSLWWIWKFNMGLLKLAGLVYECLWDLSQAVVQSILVVSNIMMVWTICISSLVWRQYIEDIKNSQKGRPHPDKQASWYHMMMHLKQLFSWNPKYEITLRLLNYFSFNMVETVNLILAWEVHVIRDQSGPCAVLAFPPPLHAVQEQSPVPHLQDLQTHGEKEHPWLAVDTSVHTWSTLV